MFCCFFLSSNADEQKFRQVAGIFCFHYFVVVVYTTVFTSILFEYNNK